MIKRPFLLIFFLFLGASVFGISCSGTGGNAPRISEKNTALRKELLQYAESFVGTPYRYGGKSPQAGLDCSGYTAHVFKKFGYSLGTSSKAQYKTSSRISKKELLPGDLVFFGNKFTKRINHVAIYAGNNKILHAPSPGKRVGYASLSAEWFHARYIGAGRILPD